MFFENFPLTFYQAPNGDNILVTDIVRAIKIPEAVLNDSNLYEYYSMKDNERPEIVSHKFYKSTQYHWVIMVLNQRYDMWNDFPVSDSVIRKKCIEKYGSIDTLHHYENDSGEWVDVFTTPRHPVTVYEYETQLNEEKRIIRVLKPAYLSEFVQTYMELIKNV